MKKNQLTLRAKYDNDEWHMPVGTNAHTSFDLISESKLLKSSDPKKSMTKIENVCSKSL
jgi:hypothetical protein